MCSPQDIERVNGTEPFQPYVIDIVSKFANDSRVSLFEVYNEPCQWRHYLAGICTLDQVNFANKLRSEAYNWVK